MSLVLPPQEMRFMNESDDQFIKIGLQNYNELKKYGFNNNTTLLDIGCGYGRLAYSINSNLPSFKGRYYGVDILEKHINWCKEIFEKDLRNYKFNNIDVKNDRYNSSNSKHANDFQFDYDDETLDFVSLFSVFTHMHGNEMENYFSEIKRMLKPGGICVVTVFIYDEQRLETINSRSSGITLHHVLDGHTRYYNIDDPLHAIAFEKSFIMELINSFDLTILDCKLGNWVSAVSDRYQDLLVIKK